MFRVVVSPKKYYVALQIFLTAQIFLGYLDPNNVIYTEKWTIFRSKYQTYWLIVFTGYSDRIDSIKAQSLCLESTFSQCDITEHVCITKTIEPRHISWEKTQNFH